MTIVGRFGLRGMGLVTLTLVAAFCLPLGLVFILDLPSPWEWLSILVGALATLTTLPFAWTSIRALWNIVAHGRRALWIDHDELIYQPPGAGFALTRGDMESVDYIEDYEISRELYRPVIRILTTKKASKIIDLRLLTADNVQILNAVEAFHATGRG